MNKEIMHITLSTHNFSVTRLTNRAKDICLHFARANIQFGLVRLPGGKFTQAGVKVFGSATLTRDEFRFHINQYKDFQEHLKRHYVTESMFSIEAKPIPSAYTFPIKVKPGWVAKEEQLPVIEYMDSDSECRSRFVDLQTGKGKAVRITEPVKVPGGWKLMGDIQVGDIVTAKDGSPTKVTGVYPQGRLQLYKVTFADGRSVECCAEHLWRVYYINTQTHKRWRVVNTLEVLRLISMPNPRVYIDLIDAEDCEDIDLPIKPYLLGVFLGDGSSAGPGVVISTPDDFIANEVKLLLPDDLTLVKHNQTDQTKCPKFGITNISESSNKNSFRQALNTMGLTGKIHYQKFIPKEYFNASKAQRLALVQGLLDTDGTVNTLHTGGAISFNSTSYELATGMQFLIRSLGGIASISTRQTNFTYKEELKAGRTSYDVNIRYKTPSELFRLPKKKERTNDNNQYAADLKLRVMSVQPTVVAEAQCISVDHPDKLFVVNDFIVTHNTFCALASIAKFSKRTVIIIKSMYIEKWVSDLLKTYEMSVKEIMVVKGAEQLQALLQMGSDGSLTSKFIIIGNKTIQNWFKLYETYGKSILQMEYACLPEDFFETIEAGMRLIDEVHQDFHLNYKIDMYTNVERSISLSATLINNDNFLEKMYRIAYPTNDRYAGTPLDKYVIARAVTYSFQQHRKVRTTEFNSPLYSHQAFEKSILRDADLKNNYFKLIWNTVDISFIKRYTKGKKCIVFCSSIAMCTELTKYMQNRYPHLKVRRYVEDDDYSNLLESDISITTILSAGTAHDIPNLMTVVLTIAVDSIQANIQSMGRLRKLPDSSVYFYYLVCQDIQKHVDYHERKIRMLEQRAASYQITNAPFLV